MASSGFGHAVITETIAAFLECERIEATEQLNVTLNQLRPVMFSLDLMSRLHERISSNGTVASLRIVKTCIDEGRRHLRRGCAGADIYTLVGLDRAVIRALTPGGDRTLKFEAAFLAVERWLSESRNYIASLRAHVVLLTLKCDMQLEQVRVCFQEHITFMMLSKTVRNTD